MFRGFVGETFPIWTQGPPRPVEPGDFLGDWTTEMVGCKETHGDHFAIYLY